MYDHVIYDSEVEHQFAQHVERMKEVKLYVKLPRWFVVPTPFREYNSNWASVWRPHDEHVEATGKPLLYLVREAKHEIELEELRPVEARKIRYGERHFRGGAGAVVSVVRLSPVWVLVPGRGFFCAGSPILKQTIIRSKCLIFKAIFQASHFKFFWGNKWF